MTTKLFEAKFYETYYVANIISNILKNPFNYVQNFDNYFGQDKIQYYVSSFPKQTIFHIFIENIVEDLWYEQLDKHIEANEESLKEPPILYILKYHKADCYTFDKFVIDYKKNHKSEFYDDIYYEYYSELRAINDFCGVKEQVVNEAFYILFQNRELLRDFHDLISFHIGELKLNELDDSVSKFLRKDGVIKRKSIPKWVKNAVYFRDRGRCAICKCDLSGTLSMLESLNYDHIVPLIKGGTNEITNIQLLCEHCNKSKGGKNTNTSNKYEFWYT